MPAQCRRRTGLGHGALQRGFHGSRLMWGRLATCGRVALGLPTSVQMPTRQETILPHELRGTPSIGDSKWHCALMRAASPLVAMPGGKPRKPRVFAEHPDESGWGAHECARHGLPSHPRAGSLSRFLRERSARLDEDSPPGGLGFSYAFAGRRPRTNRPRKPIVCPTKQLRYNKADDCRQSEAQSRRCAGVEEQDRRRMPAQCRSWTGLGHGALQRGFHGSRLIWTVDEDQHPRHAQEERYGEG